MKMKNLIIFGDSYSTFKGYIPEGYAFYYSENKREDNDITRVEETWWKSLCDELDLNLILNNSWSGSTVGYRGYNNSDCSHSSSFIYRLEKLRCEDFFTKNKIDTVLIFGATNDSWANVDLGEIKFDNFKEEDLFTVLPAICYFIKQVKETVKNANIIYIINTELKKEISDTIKLAANRFGISFVELSDITKSKGHPTIEGMRQIKNQVKSFLSTN